MSGHLAVSVPSGSRDVLTGRSDPLWFGAAAQISRFVRELTDISDITAAVGPELCIDLGAPGTALYLPGIHEVHVNSTTCLRGLEPRDVHFAEPMFKLRAKPLIGALIHESGHAIGTTWDMVAVRDRVDTNIFDILMMLEETRIEKLAMHRFRAHEPGHYLNESALRLVLEDFELPDTVYGAAGAAGLILARHDIEVLTTADIEHVQERVLALLSDPLLARLRSLWIEFQALSATEIPNRGVEIANLWWNLLVEKDPEIAAASPDPMFPSVHEGHADRDPDEDSKTGDSEIMSDIRDRTFEQDEKRSKGIRRQYVDIEISSRKELADEAQQAEEMIKREKARMRDRDAEATGHRLTAAGVLLSRTEKVNSELRSAAVQLSKALEKIQYEDVGRARFFSQTPPGRLNMRHAQIAKSQKDTGQMITAEPWRSVRRKHTDTTPMSIGVMVDVSGSMSALAKPMAQLAWVLNYAAHRANATSSTVLFGDDAVIYQMPHDRPPQSLYEVWQPGGGIEAFSEGFSLVAGALDLIRTPGARLLVIATDGYFVRPNQRARASKIMTVCRRAEIEVIWLPFSEDVQPCEQYGFGEVVSSLPRKPTPKMLADVVGSRAVQLLDRKKRLNHHL